MSGDNNGDGSSPYTADTADTEVLDRDLLRSATQKQGAEATVELDAAAGGVDRVDRTGEGGAVYAELTEIDPVSALRVGFIINSALCLVWILAMTLLWIILNLVGVWGRMNSLFQELFGLDGISPVMYFGVVAALGLVELFIFTLCVSVGAMIYNAAARLVGGLRVRLER